MVRRRATAALGALGLVGLAGCTLITDSFLSNDFSGDPFPVPVDTTTGAIMVGVRQAGSSDRAAVLDLLSPFTVTDPGPGILPSLTYADLTLLGAAPGGALGVPRARFRSAQLIAVHPCDTDTCSVGEEGGLREFGAILGADSLAGDAIRLRLGDDKMFVLPDVGGSDPARSLNCDAVFRSPYRGGGTLVVVGTELPFGNRRITVQACLGQDPDPPLDLAPPSTGGLSPYLTALNQRGSDVLLVVSTSIGITILGESAYQRYLQAHPDAPGPTGSGVVYMPSGPVAGQRARIDRLALVAAPTSNALAPCRQIYAHRLLSAHALRNTQTECAEPGAVPPADSGLLDCPCKNGDASCPVPAILELDATSDGGLDILVVPDSDPTLQALRTELRPDQPEVDGLLGTNALRAAEIDVDYPHDRLVTRCAGPGCTARPQLATTADRCQINHCIYGSINNEGCAP